MGVLLDHSRLFYSLVLAHLFHLHLPMVPALLSMAVCRRSCVFPLLFVAQYARVLCFRGMTFPPCALSRRSSYLKAFYRQLHIAYSNRASCHEPGSHVDRGLTIQRSVSGLIQFFQAARAESYNL